MKVKMKVSTKTSLRNSAKVFAALLFMLCALQMSFAQITLKDPSQVPPNGLQSQNVPQLITIGFDDNGVGDGITWILDFLKNKKNPAGSGLAGTYDGSDVRVSFYCTSNYLDSASSPDALKYIWNRMVTEGHEVGNHTWSHSELLKTMDNAGWSNEIDLCNTMISKPLPPVPTSDESTPNTGAAISVSSIVGFRTPFLAYGGPVFPLLKQKNFLYDCSIEEGNQTDQDGTNFFWPYTFDHSILSGHYKSWKGNFTANPTEAFNISDVPGLWELPQTLMMVPDDATCVANGWPTGMRGRIAKLPGLGWFVDKMTSFDWNLWDQLDLSKGEFLAILKHTFNLHYNGNRAPYTIGAHTDIYSTEADPTAFSGASLADRRAAMEEFITWVLTKPDVRIVPSKDIIKYCQYPVALQAGAGPFSLNITALNGTYTTNPPKTQYTKGETVTIQAVPLSGYVFDKWTGGATGTANPVAITMDKNKDVVANFKKAQDCAVYMDMMAYANWATAKDLDGSTIDPTISVVNDQVTVNYTVAIQSGDIWPWIEIDAKLPDGTMENMCSVKITYRASQAMLMSLPQPPLSLDGLSYRVDLPASIGTAWTTSTFLKSAFKQPSWFTGTPTPLDLTKVTYLVIANNTYNYTGKFEMKELKIYGFEPVVIDNISSSSIELENLDMYLHENTMFINMDNKAKFNLAVYSTDGKMVYNNNVNLNQGENAINLNTSLSNGTYIVRLTGDNNVAVKKFAVVK